MHLFKFFLIATVATFQGALEKESPCRSAVLEYAHKHLPTEGTLSSDSLFVYVDIDDAYIHNLVSLIEQEGFEERVCREMKHAGDTGACSGRHDHEPELADRGIGHDFLNVPLNRR